MATATQPETCVITINDVEIEVPRGELIVESVKRLGLEIPIFCYHSRMKAVGMCRMCLVEAGFKQEDGSVRMMPKPQAGCTLPASDNLVIITDSDSVHRDRRGILEFLLINHPLDCPICDRGGECPLQNNTLAYGPSTSRFIELKRHLPKAYPLSKYVTLDLERCIQCGRCVRFTEEISGDSELAFRFRGSSMQPSTFQLMEFTSKFSGNTIEICPVGALTSTRYRFRARPWDLETSPALCTVCSNGCNVWFDHRVGKFARVNGRTNEAVNEEWTCDRGKFGHEFYNSPDRLSEPLARSGEAMVPTTWSECYAQIADAFGGDEEVGLLVGSSLSNESLYLSQKVFRTAFKSNNIDHRWRECLLKFDEMIEQKHGIAAVQTPIAELEYKESIVVVGTSLADDLPIVYLRVRKAWFLKGVDVYYIGTGINEVSGFAKGSFIHEPGELNKALEKVLGSGSDKDLADAFGVDEDVASGLRSALKSDRAAIITSRAILCEESGVAAYDLLAKAASAGPELNCYALNANEQGAIELGFLPDALPGKKALNDSGSRTKLSEIWGSEPGQTPGMDTTSMLKAAASGELNALWLLGCDPFELHPDRDLVQSALENVSFLVVQDIAVTEATHFASVVLPMTAPAEEDGSYTNCERRVQVMRSSIGTLGSAKPAWRVFHELGMRHRPRVPMFHAEDVMKEIAMLAPGFEGVPYDEQWHEGILIGDHSFKVEASVGTDEAGS